MSCGVAAPIANSLRATARCRRTSVARKTSPDPPRPSCCSQLVPAAQSRALRGAGLGRGHGSPVCGAASGLYDGRSLRSRPHLGATGIRRTGDGARRETACSVLQATCSAEQYADTHVPATRRGSTQGRRLARRPSAACSTASPASSESTREAVLTALDVLGYERPTKLRGERARLVGPRAARAAEPDLPRVRRGGRRRAGPAGLHPRPVHADRRRRLARPTTSSSCSGSRCRASSSPAATTRSATPTHGHYERLAGRNLPVVLINASIEELPFPRVSCDDEVAIEQAIGHLASLGHTTIGLVLGPGRPRAVRAQAARRRRRSRSAWAWSWRSARSSAAPTRSRAGRPRATGCCARASPASCARATRWRSA